MPVVASNRIGTETFEHSHITFYGGSFIAGPAGEIVAQVGLRVTTGWGTAALDATEWALCSITSRSLACCMSMHCF
jgi:N-carbamoylputrescine amidase